MAIVYLNGAFIPEAEATISVFDRGFLFGDSIYDAICVYKNHFLSLEQHLKRLQESLQAIDLSLRIPINQLKTIFTELLERNAFQEDELTIYLQITRGVQMPRAYLVTENIRPTLLITCSPTQAKSKTELMQGLTAITLADKRRQDCYIKSTSLLPSVMAANQAKKAGFDEALLVYNDNVLESTSGNLFIVNATGEIITPPLQPHILAGVTRDIVLKLAEENGFTAREANISVEALFDATEVWITGSIKGICPIRSIDNKVIGTGEFPAKVWQQFYAFYQDYKEAHVPTRNALMQQLHVKQFTGLQPYAPVLLQMQKWIQEHPKNKNAPDELWIMEHHPVYTLGQAADAKHILNPGKIPVIRCDRGGQVTYHGPGQLMLYTLLNLDRLRLNTRTLVRQLEQWIIDYLSTFNLSPTSRIDAPGVYLSKKKICSIGLRITKKLSYHGLAFNINMDLAPFKDINPCGFSELEMTDLNHYAIRSMDQVITELVPLFAQTFNYENWEITKDHEI